MATSDTSGGDAEKSRDPPSASRRLCDATEASTQTDAKVQGHGPRLSKVNLFTLLSLWMELFPQKKPPAQSERQQTRSTGLVVVQDNNIKGLHCSSAELHAGQIAVIKHGPKLRGCDLYFSRKPCSTCLKMIVNAGVSRISYWPGDPELSLLCVRGDGDGDDHSSQEAVLDAAAAERLKSNSRPHICVLLQPLANNMGQFVEETSSGCDFLEKIAKENLDLNVGELFREQQRCSRAELMETFFLRNEHQHHSILTTIGLDNFCIEPYFSSLRQNMRDLIALLASVVSSLPDAEQGYGFYEKNATQAGGVLSPSIVKHCIIQARLLSYRTEDPKVGVGAVIWAEGKSGHCDGTGQLYLIGCGYNAYPVGSQYAEFPQMDNKQRERQCRKYRYIIHAEQNALIFRNAEIKEEEKTMIFVTKCPCDECVPLIKGAGIKQIYTTDLDSGRDKHDISYLKFDHLQGVQKFIWQKNVHDESAAGQPLSNGCTRKHDRQTEDEHQLTKKQRLLNTCKQPDLG